MEIVKETQKEENIKTEEAREITLEDIQEEIKAVTEKGTELQKYIYSDKGKAEPFFLRRLRMEQFNAYCAIVECLQAQVSCLEKE